jgi:hypothetical protein
MNECGIKNIKESVYILSVFETGVIMVQVMIEVSFYVTGILSLNLLNVQ